MATHPKPSLKTVSTAKFIYKSIEEMGLNPAILFLNTDIPESILDDPDFIFSEEQRHQMSKNVTNFIRDPLLGLKFGRKFRLDDFGTLGYAALCAKTRGDSIRIMVDLQLLSGTNFNLSLNDLDERHCIELISTTELPEELLAFYCDLEVAATVFCEGEEQENRQEVVEIHLMHNQYEFRAEYEEFFECPVKFNCDANRVFFDTAALNKPMPRADIQTSELCLQQCRKVIDQLSRQSSLIEQVREAILQKAGIFPSIIEVSKSLHMSERTLRRKLSHEGTSFQKILNEVRFQMAKEYLSTDLSIEQIAELVGYSEAANFSHAFKRWTTLSPNDYRRSLVH